METLFVHTEGHGFYFEEHRKQFYNQLLGVLGPQYRFRREGSDHECCWRRRAMKAWVQIDCNPHRKGNKDVA